MLGWGQGGRTGGGLGKKNSPLSYGVQFGRALGDLLGSFSSQISRGGSRPDPMEVHSGPTTRRVNFWGGLVASVGWLEIGVVCCSHPGQK